jgi:hypothetical protein
MFLKRYVRKEDMTTLKLLENTPEKKLDPRRHLVNIFNQAYKLKRGKDNPLPYGGCMKAMQNVFKFVDEETGEISIDYPTEDAWKSQVEGMFEDEFCAKNRIYDFIYFLKQFGRFKTKDYIIAKKNLCRKCAREIPKTFGTICPECERKELCQPLE